MLEVFGWNAVNDCTLNHTDFNLVTFLFAMSPFHLFVVRAT